MLVKCQYARTTVQKHQEARVAAIYVDNIDPAVKRIREAERKVRMRRVLEARRLYRRFAFSALQYGLANQECRVQPLHDSPHRCLLLDTMEYLMKMKRAWEAVAHKMTEVIDHFRHKQYFHPTVRELFRQMFVQPAPPP